MTPARPLAASVAALGLAGVFGVPAPATAAPAPCDRAERYAAQSGAELFRLNKLTLTPAAGDADPQSGAAGPANGAPGGSPARKDNAGQPPAGGAAGAGREPAAGTSRGSAPGGGTSGERPRAGGDTSGEHPTGGGGTPGERPRAGAGASGARVAGNGATTSNQKPAVDSGAGTATGGAGTQATAKADAGTSGDVRTGGGAGPGRAVPAGAPSPTVDERATADASPRGRDASGADGGGPGLLGTLDDLGRAAGLTGEKDEPREDVDRPKATDAQTAQPVPSPAGRPTDTAEPEATTGDATSTSDSAVRPASSTVGDVRVGEAKSALVAEAVPNSAAVARMVNGTGTPGLNGPLVQQAPPTNPEPGRRGTPAAESGPLLVDSGSLTGHAQWAPGMACGVIGGKVTRATATLRAAQVMGIGDDVLVAVPEKLESVSTTALERRGEGARTVAAATIGARSFELLNGAVTVQVVRPPTLETRMSTLDGGEVSYVPASLEVSGDGVDATTLDTAGDTVEFTIGEKDRPRTESGRMPKLGGLGVVPPLALPSIPGLPAVTAPEPDPEPEAAPVRGPGTHVRISLGEVRQAALGHAVAARASAVRIAIGEGTTQGYDEGRAGTLLDLEIGVLESAAVAPEPRGGRVAGAGGGVSDAGGALPLTGPRVDLLALAGVVLLAVGAGALAFGLRTRRFRA